MFIVRVYYYDVYLCSYTIESKKDIQKIFKKYNSLDFHFKIFKQISFSDLKDLEMYERCLV